MLPYACWLLAVLPTGRSTHVVEGFSRSAAKPKIGTKLLPRNYAQPIFFIFDATCFIKKNNSVNLQLISWLPDNQASKTYPVLFPIQLLLCSNKGKKHSVLSIYQTVIFIYINNTRERSLRVSKVCQICYRS